MNYRVKQKLRQITLYIGGMTCNSCERRIENAVKKVGGVKKVNADYSKSKVLAVYDSNIAESKKIIDAITKAGYDVVPKPRKIGRSKRKQEKDQDIGFGKLLCFGVIIYLGYRALQNFGVDFLPQINQNSGYGILFVIGLLTSVHCIGMCGGINISQTLTKSSREEPNKLKPSFMYNAGRLISYTLLGGIIGAIGSVLSFSGSAKGLVAIIAGCLMIIMALNMLNVFPALRKLNPRIPKVCAGLVGKSANRGPFIVGLLNGLMPCGPLQAMQLYALGTGSFIAGAASMFFFGLGTVPLMFGLGAISSFLSGQFTRKMMKAGAVLVMVLGIIMLGRGLSLSGISMFPTGTEGVVASVKGNSQTVVTTLEPGRYTPIVVQKGIPVKWTIRADEDDLNGCNNPIVIPRYNLTKELKPGDNVIEFVPTEEGDIVYTCWMGMIRSSITVVEDINNIRS